jgi:hypothetical protein
VLLEFRADPNIPIKKNIRLTGDMREATYYEGFTAVHIAIRKMRNLPILRLLKEFNADFGPKDVNGWTPIDVALHDNNRYGFNYCYDLGFRSDKNFDGIALSTDDEQLVKDGDDGQQTESARIEAMLTEYLQKTEQMIRDQLQKNEHMMTRKMQEIEEAQRDFEWRVSRYFLACGLCFIYCFLASV